MAQIERVKDLQNVGEFYLAKNQLLGMFLYGKEAALRRKAFESLSKFYERVSDNRGLLSLLSSYVLDEPDIHILNAMVNCLVEEGRYKEALMLGLTIPDEDDILYSLIRSSYKIEWWQVFDDLLSRVPDIEKYNYWMGQKALKHGDKSQALGYLRRAGEEGKEWINFLKETELIDSGLSSGDSGRVKDAIVHWEELQKMHPGNSVLKENHCIVDDYAGAVMLYSTSLNKYSHAYVSNDRKPVSIKVTGPVTIRLETRPLHDNTSSINEWLKIEDSGRLSVFPISNNVPSQNISVVGNRQLIPGNRVTVEYKVGPGLHEIMISGEKNSLLVRVHERSPELQTMFLPQLTQAAISLKSGETYAGIEKMVSEDQSNGNSIVKGDIEGFSIPMEDNDPLRRMIDLLWIAEHDTDQHENVLAEAHEICVRHSSMLGIKALLNRINKESKYTHIKSVQSSAGIYYKEISGWQPESQFLAVRKALLPPVSSEEDIIYGYKKLNVSMINKEKEELVIRLKMADVGYIRPTDMKVSMQLDDTDPRYIQVTADLKEEVLAVSVPAGKHHIQLGLENPVLNQFLIIKVAEKDTAGMDSPAEMPWKKSLERQYFVSTRDTPAKLHLKGPGLLRINELVDDSGREEYRKIEDGWQDIEIRPENNQEERFLRFFRKVAEEDKPVVEPRMSILEKEHVDRHNINIRPLSLMDPVDISDSLRLGGQEDGTWTLHSSFTGRKNQQEDSENNQAREEFLEFGAIHRHFNEARNRLTELGVLGRKRSNGEPTIGFTGSIIKNIRSPRLTIQLKANIYFQRPESVHSSDLEWTGFLRGEITRRFEINPKISHSPKVSLFVRGLSLNKYGKYDSKDVDQDIFTPYKRQHMYGMRVSETISYRPWLDSLFYVTGRLNLNEDFNPLRPDNYHVRGGWKQLVGSLQFNATYNYRDYLVDRDRKNSKIRHNIKLGVLWNRWSKKQNRMECGVEMIHQLESGINSGTFFLQWHLGNGRGLRDFSNGAIDFLDVRRFWIPRKRNNTFKYK